MLGTEIFSSGVSSHVLLRKGNHIVLFYCVLTALVSQGERGIVGACGHYTVIGYPDYMAGGFGIGSFTTQWGGGGGLGVASPTPPRSHL